jgi:hypothetical protein
LPDPSPANGIGGPDQEQAATILDGTLEAASNGGSTSHLDRVIPYVQPARGSEPPVKLNRKCAIRVRVAQERIKLTPVDGLRHSVPFFSTNHTA